MIDKSTLVIGQSYNLLVPDWSKFKEADLKDDSFKPPLTKRQADATLVFVMSDFKCDRVEIFPISYIAGKKEKIDEWVLKLSKDIEKDKNYMFYDPSDDRFIYADENDFQVKESISLPIVYSFERINEQNLNRLAYALNASETKESGFNFYFSKQETQASDLFWEKLLNFIFPFNKVRSGGKFLIQNQDGSFDGEELDEEILNFLKGQAHEKSYRTIIQYKKKKYKVFPTDDWRIIDKVPLDNEGKPVVVIGGFKRGIMLRSDKLDICVAIPGWNLSKLLLNGFVINGKLMGSYGLILHRSETALLLPENGKLFKKLKAFDKNRAGLFDELIVTNSPLIDDSLDIVGKESDDSNDISAVRENGFSSENKVDNINKANEINGDAVRQEASNSFQDFENEGVIND